MTKYDYQVGVVAMDDFDLWVGTCSMSAVNCDFESSLCGWTDDKTHSLEWVRATANDGAESMGFDHTTNSAEGKKLLLLYEEN